MCVDAGNKDNNAGTVKALMSSMNSKDILASLILVSSVGIRCRLATPRIACKGRPATKHSSGVQ
ncbi:hypothetical protein [Mycobacterium lepromatosis]|uniref:hypothetical protein n=1 Tax=Mycobacterium lepromatosis TaxID=480418 RepID=UPI000B1B7FA5|nr:hypothetical protein [Mycobacterium lepromatosis]